MSNTPKSPPEAPTHSGAGTPGQEARGGRLARWSARKTDAARVKADDANAEAIAARDEAEKAEILEQQAANRLAAEAVDIDTADYQTDFTPFLKDGVPTALRRQALKALWRTNPLLANVDGLNDYDEDFRIVESAFKTVTSSWEVGRGYAGQADDVTREMMARDQIIEDAAEAEKAELERLAGEETDEPAETADAEDAVPEDAVPEGAAPEEADTEPGDDPDRDETADENIDLVGDTLTQNDPLPTPAHPSPRASLRHRLRLDGQV